MVMKGERVELECEVSEEGANVKWLESILYTHKSSSSIRKLPVKIIFQQNVPKTSKFIKWGCSHANSHEWMEKQVSG